MKLTGAQALIKSLEMEEVEVMFGLPGGAILPVYDPLIDSSIRHILVRHEQGAGHMASGYAHATGRPGVAMVTSGPAATNIVTPLCDAYMDSIPMVAITGQVPYSVIGTDAFQECDTVGITMPVTKHNWLITDANDIPQIVREAFHVATTGRPGPVLVDVPKDIANQHDGLVLAREGRPSGLQADGEGTPEADQGRGASHQRGEAAGDLRRRRHLEGPRRRGPARARRADGYARRHHAHGPWLLPRRSPAVPRHARHARELHRGHVDAEGRSAHHLGCALRRPRHRQGRARSRPTRRSSTSTSTRPSRARCAGPTCRSSATAAS